MIKPDLILVWPRYLDYPKFRNFINTNRELFDNVLISFTEGDLKLDFTEEVTNGLIDVLPFLAKGSGDWRNVATNQLLNVSSSEWVLFMEQDFSMSGETLAKYLREFDGEALGFRQESRLHPAFLLIKRSILDQTSKDFSAYPPKHDHFGKVTGELLCDVALLKDEDFEHMNGLSHNFALCVRKTPEYLYERDKFTAYLVDSLKYKHSDKYKDLVKHCLEAMNEDFC
jgi:hypothetical protein